MRRSWNLTAKLVAAGSTFLVLALLSVGVTLWVTWQLEGTAAAVNEAGRMRMQSYRLGLAVEEGRDDQVAQYVARFDATLALLREGDAARPLFVPWDPDVAEAFDAVERRWKAVRGPWRSARDGATMPVSEQADALAGDVDRLVSAIEARIATSTSLMQLLQMSMLGLAIAAAVVMLYIGYIVVLEPVARLQRGLAQVERGELEARVEVGDDDEFGRLAEGFNRMAERLQDSYRSLEDKVREKTASLEREQARLQCLYEVTTRITTATSLDELAQGFARHVARAARADASAIRWADPQRQRFVLLASHCLPDSISEGEACVRTGECHCGSAAVSQSARVIPIRADANGMASRCASAGFMTVVALPVRQQDRLIGEVELFFHEAVELQEHERTLLEALVAHLATAIEGFRLTALERETAVSRERNLIAQELHDSIAQSLAFLKIQVQLLRGALARGDAAGIEKTLAEIDDGVRESSGDVRELLMHFRTRADADDVATALRTTLSKFEHQTGIPTELHVEGHGLPIPPDVQVQVLHVLQEALSNVRKHAGASRVRLAVVAAPRWRFEVDDDGHGFDAVGPDPGETHVGMRIMRERAERIGATLSIASERGRGTKVVLELPRSDAMQAPAAAPASAGVTVGAADRVPAIVVGPAGAAGTRAAA
jgi:two-component system nitrate/nitrite sensor histidine kinase NarX